MKDIYFSVSRIRMIRKKTFDHFISFEHIVRYNLQYIIFLKWERNIFSFRELDLHHFLAFEIGYSSGRWARNFRVRDRRVRRKFSVFSYLLFPCEKATIVPELASSWRSAAAIVNSGTRRSSAAARSKLASFSRSSLSSPESSKTPWSVRQDGMRCDRPRSGVLGYRILLGTLPVGSVSQFASSISNFFNILTQNLS